MGQQHQQQQTPQQATQFHDAAEAHDRIAPYLTAQFQFREQGINQACNQLKEVDQPSLGQQLLKSGLKIGLAAAAGAVGLFTAGLGWVALGAIGAGFGLGGELVDAAFSGNSVPAGVEEFRTKRLNVLYDMQARETDALRQRLTQRTTTDWTQAYTDYQNMQRNAALQNTEIDATIDGWMNAINSNANGTGGTLRQGDEGLTDVTTGRLHIQGSATPTRNSISVGVRSASLDGLDNASLRNRYLDRTIGQIGLFCQFAFYAGGEMGGIGFRADSNQYVIEGGNRFKSALGRMSIAGAAMTGPDYNWANDASEGAGKVGDILKSWKLRDFNIQSIDNGGMFE